MAPVRTGNRPLRNWVLGVHHRSGPPPFTNGSPWHVMHQHCTQPPPPLVPRFAVPSDLEAWVNRLLNKKPEQRFRFAADASRALRALDDIEISAWDEDLPTAEHSVLGGDETVTTDRPPGFTPVRDDVTIKSIPPSDLEWAQVTAASMPSIHDRPPFPETWQTTHHPSSMEQLPDSVPVSLV